jgi:copper(I)-binding protein
VSFRTARPAALLACLALGLAPALAACGAGPNAVAARDYAPGDGLLANVGDLRVQNVVVVGPPEGGSDGVLSMAVANRGQEPDRLVAVTLEEGTARIEGATEIPPRGQILFGGEDADSQVVIEGLTAESGATTEVTLRFEQAGQVDLAPPVVTAHDYYEGIVAPAEPTPGAGTPGTAAATPAPEEVPTTPDTSTTPGAEVPTPAG